MHFEVEQRFTAAPPDVIDLYTDPAFYELLRDLPRVGQPEVRDRVVNGHLITMRVHYRFTADLPTAATAVIDRDKLTWIEETVYDVNAMTSSSQLLPDNYADRLTAGATTTFAEDSATGGTRRSISADCKVRFPVVGGKVEGAIVSGLREHLADEAAVANRQLAE